MIKTDSLWFCGQFVIRTAPKCFTVRQESTDLTAVHVQRQTGPILQIKSSDTAQLERIAFSRKKQALFSPR